MATYRTPFVDDVSCFNRSQCKLRSIGHRQCGDLHTTCVIGAQSGRSKTPRGNVATRHYDAHERAAMRTAPWLRLGRLLISVHCGRVCLTVTVTLATGHSSTCSASADEANVVRHISPC